MARYTTKKALYRHASDQQCCDCGRACAQMIISSLTHAIAAGVVPTPAQEARPVPSTQDQLQAREAQPADVTGGWFTFPDEMLKLLKKDPNLVNLGWTDWRLANCASPAELFAWAAKSIRAGMPAVLNINASDHWVCLRSVEMNAGVLSLLEYLDPLLPHESDPPGPNDHTYKDLCDLEENWAVIEQTPGELGTWEIPVGATPPTKYQGRCVGIVYGPRPPKKAAAKKSAKKKAAAAIGQIAETAAIKSAAPADPAERARILLTELATNAGISTLNAVLDAKPEITVRTVRDITGAEKPYTIASMFASRAKRGAVAIFNEDVTRFFQLRLTSNQRLIRSIAASKAADPLWWKREGLSTLYAPHFPFSRFGVPGRWNYRRLIDGQVLYREPKS